MSAAPADVALAHHCRLSIETMHPRFGRVLPLGFSVVLTVNSGYEWIQEGFGGPVWHASVATQGIPYGRSALEAQAERELAGLGDAALGEWREFTGRAFHLRRRLSTVEAAHVGPVVDVRRTPEAQRRAQALGKMLRFAPPEVLADEIG